jgi:hypothetical protein
MDRCKFVIGTGAIVFVRVDEIRPKDTVHRGVKNRLSQTILAITISAVRDWVRLFQP